VVFWMRIWETVICYTRCSAALASHAVITMITINEAPTRIALRTGAVHCLAHLLTCNLLDDLLLHLLCHRVGANRQSPMRPDEMAGVAVGISLEIILMLAFGLPEVARRNDFRNDPARPQA
jgi:hypothetical protein